VRYCSGGALLGFVDQLKELCPSLVEALGGLIIAASGGNCIQLIQSCFRLEMAFAFGNERNFSKGVIIS
jgi:hypothetical protein